jgi:hypothetical protein
MQANKETFDISGAVAAGEAMPVDRYSFKSIHLKPDGGNYTIDVSLDGNNWINLITNIAAETFYSTEGLTDRLPKAVNFMRIVTNSAGGAPFAFLFGHDPA